MIVPSATAFLCFCVVAVYSFDGEENSKRFRRDVVSGLVSFPRIGRNDQILKMGPQEAKRQSLVSFPRTGKRDPVFQLPDAPWPEPEGKTWALVQFKDLFMLPKSGREFYGNRFTGESSEDTG